MTLFFRMSATTIIIFAVSFVVHGVNGKLINDENVNNPELTHFWHILIEVMIIDFMSSIYKKKRNIIRRFFREILLINNIVNGNHSICKRKNLLEGNPVQQYRVKLVLQHDVLDYYYILKINVHLGINAVSFGFILRIIGVYWWTFMVHWSFIRVNGSLR